MKPFPLCGSLAKFNSARRGFTIAELLASMAVSALIIAATVSLALAIYRLNERVLSRSSEMYDIRSLRYYLVEHAETIGENSIEIRDGEVINADLGEKIVDGDGITDVKIYFEYLKNDDSETFAFKRCAITYSGGTYDFIIGVS